MKTSSRKWYVLCVEPGKENKVRAELLKKAKILGLYPHIYKTAIVPVLREVEARAKDGKPVMVEKIKYDGYIFLNMEWCDEVRDLVDKAKYTFGLLPHRPNEPKLPPNKQPSKAQIQEFERWVNWEPTGLDSTEAARLLLEQQSVFKKKVPPPAKYSTGELVRIVDKNSAFAKLEGKIVVGDDDSLNIYVTILGKEMPVTVEPWQIERVVSK